MPNVAKAHWDWRNQVGWVRFEAGKVAKAEDLESAITKGTMFTGGKVTFIEKVEDLPDDLR